MGLGDNLLDFTTMKSGYTALAVNSWITQAEKVINKIKGRSSNDPYTAPIKDSISAACLEITKRIAQNKFTVDKYWGKDGKMPPLFPLVDDYIMILLDGNDGEFSEFDLAFDYYIR